MRLATWSEWVSAPAALLFGNIFLALIQIFVDTREPNQFEEAAAERPGSVFSICRDGPIFHWSSPQKVIVKSKPVVETEHVCQDWMIKKVFADMRRLDDWFDSMS